MLPALTRGVSTICGRAWCRTVSFLAKFQQLTGFIFFTCSAKRQAQLEEFQEFFKEEKHKILKLSKTRWLCRQHCVARILEQWDVLLQFFTVASFEEANYPPSRKRVATEKLKEMKNPYNKAYYLFLEYA